MSMTLEQVRDWHLMRVRKLTNNEAAGEHYKMAAAIDAHLAQPAQSVDVEKVKEVIAWIRNDAIGYAGERNMAADKLARAIGDKP